MRSKFQLREWYYILAFTLPFSSTTFATSFSLTVDNDGIFGTDEDYTSGLLLDFSSELGTNFIGAQYWRLQLGQKIWTPSDLEAEEPQANQRPYAGLLYAQGSILKRTDTRLQEYGLLFGTTGPDSYAEKGQKYIHRITASTRPVGWDYQIENQVVGSLQYRENFLVANPGPKHEISSLFRVEAGNFRSDLATGLVWRWGTELTASFGSINPSNEGSFSPVNLSSASKRGAFLFSGLEARYRFNDITIEGETIRETPQVHLQNAQATLVFGGVAYRNNAGVSITFASKTKDYKEAEFNITNNASFSAFMRF